MGLFLIEHTHTPETCPTRNLEIVRQLRAHVTPENARGMGVAILGDWVSEPDHTVVFIVESASGTVTVEVEPGDEIVCTITNVLRPFSWLR